MQKPPDPEAAWQERQQRLRALSHWGAEGRLSVRLDRDGGQAHFDWTQTGERFQLRLSGPWGQGGAVLEGAPGRATLDAGGGRQYQGRDARKLLASVYGWDIPVAGLRYWLLGLPREQSDYRLDRFGRLAELHWKGWRIVYERYQRVDALALPARIRVRRDADTEVRVAIDEWRLDGAGETDGSDDELESPVPLIGG